MVRTKKRLRVCLVLLILNVMLIWGNSLMPGWISAKISGVVRKIVAFFLSAGSGKPVSGGEGILRKTAHYLEFACLGMCLSCLVRMLSEKKNVRYLMPLLGGILVACTDETIQRFVPGRSGQLSDVGIDTLGVITGIVIISLIQICKKQKFNYMEEKNQ